jgi:hypothetical protein
MMLLLSLLITQGCQYHGYLLSFHDDLFVMQRRDFTMNYGDATRGYASKDSCDIIERWAITMSGRHIT